MSYFKEFISSIWIITCGLVVRTIAILQICALFSFLIFILLGLKNVSLKKRLSNVAQDYHIEVYKCYLSSLVKF